MKEKYSSKGLITNIIKSIEEVKGEEVILIDMKNIFYINWYSFFIAFIFGIIYVYFITQNDKYVMFENINNNIYNVENNEC